ncbi:hypothetical protein KAH94_04470, partial [bacterium]|nr:hypothetical protein [bacterium]
NIINEVKCSRCDTVLSFNYKEIFMNETDKNISILLVKKDSIQIELNQIKKELERNRNEYKKIKEVLTKKNEFQQYIELTEIEMKNKKNINEKTEFYLIENKDILEKNYEELKELNEELKDLNEKKENDILGKIEEKEKEKDILLKEINNLKNIKDNYLKQKKEYKIEKIIYDKLKWECNCFNILKNIFGKNGIVAEIIKESIEEVETEANNVLQEINNGEYRIIFDTIKETKKGEFSDSLDIYIENNRAVRIYESYSGGQRAIINFAIRMSLSKILSKLNNVSFGFVALDEVFGALDEHNKNKMIEVINYLKPFFYQILVISHTNLKECFENNIMIEFNKNTGISKIKEIY